MENLGNHDAEDDNPKVSPDIFANHRNPDGTVDWEAFIRDGEARQKAFLDKISGPNNESLSKADCLTLDALIEEYGPFPELTAEDVHDMLYGSPDVSTWESFEQGPPQVQYDPSEPVAPPAPDA